jgi:hypothetical protein
VTRRDNGWLLWKTAGAILFVNASCSLVENFSGLTAAGGGGSTANTSAASTAAGQTGAGGMTATSSTASSGNGTAGAGIGGQAGSGGATNSATSSGISAVSSGAGGAPATTVVHSGAAVIAGGAASQAVGIASVDRTRSVLFFTMSCDDPSGFPGDSQVSGALATNTMLTFTRFNSGGTPPIEIQWYVVEFGSGVSVQRGSLHAPSTNVVDIPITAVNLAHSFPIISKSVSGNVFDNNDYNRAELTTSTNLELTIDGGAIVAGGTIEWQVVEYQSSTVQSGDLSFDNPTDLTRTATLATSIDPSKSLLIFSHGIADTGVSAFPSRSGFIGAVTDPTTLTFSRSAVDPAVGADSLTYYLVEFTDATSVQSGSTPFGVADVSLNAALTPVDLKRSVPTAISQFGRTGATAYGANTNVGVNTFNLTLASATNLSMARATNLSSNAILNWSVVEFQ